MNQTIARRISIQRAEDLRRLADQGERNGVRILFDRRHDQHIATSATHPHVCYLVDHQWGCSCRGFQHWGRCQHHSLLSQLGMVPEHAESDPAPPPGSGTGCGPYGASPVRTLSLWWWRFGVMGCQLRPRHP